MDKIEPQVTVVYNQPPFLNKTPTIVVCPSCQKRVLTKTKHLIGIQTWFGCVAILFFGGVLGCCIIPFFCDDCKVTQHSCPNCNYIVQ